MVDHSLMKTGSAGASIGVASTIGLALTFVIGIILSLSAFSIVRAWEKSELQASFEFAARNRLASIQTDILRHQDSVSSLAGLFSSMQHVDREQFHSFAQNILSQQSSIQGLAWNPLIMNAERKDYEQLARDEGFTDFQITELDSDGKQVVAGEHKDYVAVYFIEPFQGNEKAIGFNIASHPGRLKAIHRARDTGDVAITERIKLVQEQGESYGYLMFKAVYRKAALLNTVTDRRENFIGLATGVFRFKDLVSFTRKDDQPVGADIWILDESASTDKRFLYFHSSRTRTEVYKPELHELRKLMAELHWQTEINVLGRNWMFVFTPAPAFLTTHQWWQAWVVLVTGLVMTLFLTLYLFGKARDASRLANANADLLREISERKAVDVALKESEKRYRALVKFSSDWVWEVDANWVYTYASPKVYELLGYQPDEIVGKKVFDLLTAEEAERVALVLAEITSSKRSFHNLENDYRHKSGRTVTFETSGVPVVDGSGALLSYRGVDRDITERITNLAELRAQRDFMDTVLDAASNLIVVLDLKGHFVRFNRAAEELTKYKLEEVLGKPVWDLVIPEEQKAGVEQVFNNLRAGNIEVASQYQNEWLDRDGGRYLLQWHNSVLRDDNGVISHIVAMGYNISEKKQAEVEHERLQRELQQAQKMESLGQLTGGIAHDFNNLLGIINGYTSLILENYKNKGDEKLLNYVEHVIDAGDRAAQLVAQMLAFSRSDSASEFAIAFEPLMKEDFKMLRATLPSTIEMEMNIEPGLPAVLMNPIHLHQILMNLAINARDAMQGNGQMKIRLAWVHNLDTESQISHRPVRGSWIELSVSDTGTGIDAAMANNIFDPFFTTKEVGKGTGMGLSVIYGIMETHGGHILLESEPGKGSTFRMLFPPAPEADEALSQQVDHAAELPRGDGSEILIVDDEQELGNFIAELVMSQGYKTHFVVDSSEALALFQRQPDRFSMLITDQTMPKLTGIELIGKLREIRAELPVILCTGYSEKIDASTVAGMAISYFEKPVDSKLLLLKMAELLDTKSIKAGH